MYFNNCVEGNISECLFDTAHKTPSAQKVETLKLQLSTYNSFFTCETQEGACECLMLLIEIMDKGFGLCSVYWRIYASLGFNELTRSPGHSPRDVVSFDGLYVVSRFVLG